MKYLMEFGQEIDYLQGLSTDLPRFPLERYKLDRYRSGEEHFSNCLAMADKLCSDFLERSHQALF